LPIAKAWGGYTGIGAIGLLRAPLRFGLLATLRGWLRHPAHPLREVRLEETHRCDEFHAGKEQESLGSLIAYSFHRQQEKTSSSPKVFD
jgi:hypothetical protein